MATIGGSTEEPSSSALPDVKRLKTGGVRFPEEQEAAVEQEVLED